MKFSGDVTSRLVRREMPTPGPALKFVLADAGVSYQLVKAEEEHPFLLAGTAGVCATGIRDTTLVITGSVGQRPLKRQQLSFDVEDPVLGLRGSQYFTKKFHLDFAGDIGGFGISDEHIPHLDLVGGGSVDL